MEKLTLNLLVEEARRFCEEQCKVNHASLIGVTDGKNVGTYIEHKFQKFLREKYHVTVGNSAAGIDFPDEEINTDIKVTSISQPQSSSPFRSAKQKIYGLGYHLLVFVYEKVDQPKSCQLKFHYLTFIDKSRTSDYTLTFRLRQMLSDGADRDDIISLLQDRNIPGDEIVYGQLADEIFKNPPAQGYLTISNALQWRLQYNRVIRLNNSVEGVNNHEWRP